MAENTSDRSDRNDGGLVGRLLGRRFRLLDVVSAGANTIICDALDERANLAVTVKIVRPELVESPGFRREFERRGDIAMALSHPNIAAVLGWGVVELDADTTSMFWAVEHLGGGSLRDLLDRGRLLAPSQALVVGLEACRALDAAHQRGLVHTELTPSKLVFGVDKRLRIIDFSMAELLGRGSWLEPATVATHVARYASPEQALGLTVDAKTDVYALALSLLESVTGTVPFSADSTVATLAARLDKLLPVSADLGSLASVLERAARPDAGDRFTAAEFGRALVQAAERLPRPEPIPVLASTLFDTSSMRRPSDPTGGVQRPPDGDEPSTAQLPVTEALPVAEPTVDDGQPTVDDGPSTAQLPVTEALPVADQDGAGDDALIILTDVAEQPAGFGQADAVAAVAADTAHTGADAAGAVSDDDTAVEPTRQMPATPMATPGLEPEPPSTVYDDERPKRRTGPIIALTLLTLVGIVAVAIAATLLVRTKAFEVPDLTGVQEAVARNEVAGNDWVIEVETERSDERPVEGTVIRTFPMAGIELEEGQVFTLFVSEGPQFRVLPDVTGLDVVDAQARLEALQLSGFVDGDEFDEVAAPGEVLSWRVQGDASMVAGDDVLPGAAVGLTISKGPAARVVPSVIGLTIEEAKQVVGELRLFVTIAGEAFDDDAPIGQIVSQDTEPGTEIARDTTFTVTVSKGVDLIELPDLTGLTFVVAQQTLTEAGFTIGSLLGTTDGIFESLNIDAEPIDGRYRRGTEVDLIFLGVEPEPEPAGEAPAEGEATSSEPPPADG